jgi:hypothetical protein
LIFLQWGVGFILAFIHRENRKVVPRLGHQVAACIETQIVSAILRQGLSIAQIPSEKVGQHCPRRKLVQKPILVKPN